MSNAILKSASLLTLVIPLLMPVSSYATGAVGAQGPKGDKGPQGPQGIQGKQGPIGKMGATGPKGDKGIQGAQGIQGKQGIKGATGPKGDKGPAYAAQGPKGDTGPQGPIGLTGATGAQGIQGVAGPIGLTGAQGTQGPIGLLGAQGLKGDTGLQGPIGLIGPQEIQGQKGDTGLTGPAGADSTVAGPVGPRGPAGLTQAGNNVGEMQYWDGVQWHIIPLPNPIPVAPAKATLSLCNGIPTWSANCVPTQQNIYHIGDKGPAGGIVFYLNNSSGLHGLEAAPADLNNGALYTWGCWGWDNNKNDWAWTPVGTTSTAIGTGATNTASVIAACGSGGGLGNSSPVAYGIIGSAVNAASAAEAYTLNGFTDWYLPSKDELNILYQQHSVVGGFLAGLNDYYFSSSENLPNGPGEVWLQVVGNSGYQSSGGRENMVPVRPIRSF